MKEWTILSRHKNWVSGATITESYSTNGSYIRRFVATVRGWRNFKIYEGIVSDEVLKKIVEKVRSIRDNIDNNNENVFTEDSQIKN